MPLLRRTHPYQEVTVGRKTLRIDLRDRVICGSLFLNGNWEPQHGRVMERLALAGKVCVDVGANIGIHTLTLSDLVGPSGRVFSLEPSRRSFDLLECNVKNTGATNVTTLRVAAGDAVGVCSISLHPWNHGDNRIATDDSPDWPREDVPLTRLDDVLRGVPDGQVAFIKVDVQGYECHVLRGMRATLTRNPEIVVMLELHPEALHGAGFTGRDLIEEVNGLGLSGWEFQPSRILPITDASTYDLFWNGTWTDLLVSRTPEKVKDILLQAYSQTEVELVRIPP